MTDLEYEDKFWNNIISEKDKHIIINGECFFDDGFVENPDRWTMIGYGGRLFHIRFFDGHMINTNNLWFNGKIPERFRKYLPDTAEFC